MFRQYTEPRRSQYDTEEEYNEALEAYDREMMLREDYLVEKRIRRERQTN